jgi:oligopeptide transport system permease protein
MLGYAFRRLASAFGVLFVVASLSFLMMRLAPGGPFDAEKPLAPAVERNLWKTYGMATDLAAPNGGEVEVHLVGPHTEVTRGTPLLRYRDGSSVVSDRDGRVLLLMPTPGSRVEPGQVVGAWMTPLWQQYLSTMRAYARLDFGVTFSSEGRDSVASYIARALPVSLELGLWGIALALVMGVPAGLFAALKEGSWLDHGTMALAMLGVSVSAIVLGPLLRLALGSGDGPFDYGGWDSASKKVLPIATLGLIYAAYFARLSRAGLLEVIQQDYIRTARAKGLTELQVVVRHALRGALLPTVSFLGPATAGIVTGSVVVERIFNIPGISEYFVSAALNRDYPLVMGVVLVYSALLVLLNLAVDLLYTALDPRVTYVER